jgi:hypothetical protein
MLRTSARNEQGDEGRRQAFEIDGELTDGDVMAEVLFVDTSKRP